MKAKSQKGKKMKVHHVSKVPCVCQEHTTFDKCAKEKKKETDGAVQQQKGNLRPHCVQGLALTESGGPRWALLASQSGSGEGNPISLAGRGGKAESARRGLSAKG